MKFVFILPFLVIVLLSIYTGVTYLFVKFWSLFFPSGIYEPMGIMSVFVLMLAYIGWEFDKNVND